MDPREHLIVALDVGGLSRATALVDRLGEEVLWYKVGLELYAASGPEAVRMLKERGKRVFLDLKLHDIPNTVSRAAAELARLGVDIIDVHVAAGDEAMAGAADAVREAAPVGTSPVLLGVTILTSTAVDAAGRPLTPDALIEEVSRRALAAQAAGLDGVVCPSRAAEAVHRRCAEGFGLLVPGIRPAGAERGDQHWVATPASALAAGARWLVVGRPIHGSEDPVGAAASICAEIRAAIV
jgi:orotidine-5'-phosphate decarboxylase